MLDKIKTNLRKVGDGFQAMRAEWREAAGKVADAWKRRDYLDLLHHLSDFRGAAQQHLWRLWFYTFWPRWILIGYLIWAT